MFPRLSWLIAIATLFIFSCNESKFRGEQNRRTKQVDPALDVSENQDRTNNPVPGGTKPDGSDPSFNEPNSPLQNIRREVLTFRCHGDGDASTGEIEFTGKPEERIHAMVKGEFCPASTEKINVLFIVDFSASMGRWRKTDADNWREGNDVQQNGTCGRLKAAQAIMNKFDQQLVANNRINVGTIAFAGDIVADYSDTNLQSAQNYQAQLTSERYCRFVAQSTAPAAQAPGAIAPQSSRFGRSAINGHTNYQAAFDKARGMLAGVKGRSVVYFISDGAPTLPSQNAIEAGDAAGKTLRDTVGNMTVNALMLGAQNAGAEDVLKKVTGSNRIVYAQNAAQLDEKILTFPEASIDEGTVAARMNVAPYPERALGVADIKKTNKKIWTYLTQPFVLLGQPGETTDNKLTVTAKGQDGSTMTSVITIRYTQE